MAQCIRSMTTFEQRWQMMPSGSLTSTVGIYQCWICMPYGCCMARDA